MSGMHHDIWWVRFFYRECEVSRKGYEVVNPARTIIANHPWLYWLVGYRLTLWYDLQLLKRCDFITMVEDDWRQSRGARLERLKARQWGIPELKPKTPAWIQNANFDILADLQKRYQKAILKNQEQQ